MVHTSLMPCLAAFYARPEAPQTPSQVGVQNRSQRSRLGLRFVKEAPKKGILAELCEAGCHD